MPVKCNVGDGFLGRMTSLFSKCLFANVIEANK